VKAKKRRGSHSWQRKSEVPDGWFGMTFQARPSKKSEVISDGKGGKQEAKTGKELLH